MTIAHPRRRQLAILIDAENISPRVLERLFAEVAAIGEASVRRIYGDFSGTKLKGWCEALVAHAIVPQQNFASTTGKNASDIALVIDAMDLLHTGRFDAFCLVSSDGDFTRLAARIREQGLDVYGFGERKAPESFRKACRRYFCIDADRPQPTPAAAAATPPKQSANAAAVSPKRPAVAPAAPPKQPPDAAVPLIRTALGRSEGSGGWHCLGAIGSHLAKSVPGFDHKTYGCTKMVTLVEKSGAFDVRRDGLRVLIRDKARPTPAAART